MPCDTPPYCCPWSARKHLRPERRLHGYRTLRKVRKMPKYPSMHRLHRPGQFAAFVECYMRKFSLPKDVPVFWPYSECVGVQWSRLDLADTQHSMDFSSGWVTRYQTGGGQWRPRPHISARLFSELPFSFCLVLLPVRH